MLRQWHIECPARTVRGTTGGTAFDTEGVRGIAGVCDVRELSDKRGMGPAPADQPDWMNQLSHKEEAPPLYWWMVFIIVMIWAVGGLLGWVEARTMAYLLVLTIPIGLVARTIGRDSDRTWIPHVIVLGYVAKILASTGRYWALVVLYGGSGDAAGYHGSGVRFAPIWRALEIPGPTGLLDFWTGTDFVDKFTGLLYVPHIPTMLGGFYLFATLAFLGQVLFYATFRRVFPAAGLKWYAFLIFFFSNLLYWPSSIGKDSLMLLFIAIASYGAVRLFSEYRPRWLPVLMFGVAGAGIIRSHMGLLIMLSLGAAIALGRRPQLKEANFRRLVSLAGMALVLAGALAFAIQDFGIDLSGGINDELVQEELDPVFSGVESQTDKGGSAVEGNAIRSIADVPQGVLRVLFSPLPYEAHNAQALVNSVLEGTFLLGLFVWRMPAIVRNFRKRWREPYMMYALVYVTGFIFGHSAVLNLGIMARQRSQAIPLVLVILVGLGGLGTKRVRRGRQGEQPEPQAELVGA